MKYPNPDGWVSPRRTGYKMACCDCGLVHRLVFRIVPNDHGPGKKIQFRVERDNRATGQMRRWKGKKLEETCNVILKHAMDQMENDVKIKAPIYAKFEKKEK